MRYAARAPLRIDFGGGWTDVPEYSRVHGGAVLSAAITRYVRGSIARPAADGVAHVLRGDRSYLSYSLDVPTGAGLGASAAQTVLWVTLVKTTIANVSDRAEVAEIACEIARLLGVEGGKQDEYSSALGGVNLFTFSDTVHSERLSLSTSFADELRSRLVLVYCGARRFSGRLHEQVWARYRLGDADVLDSLGKLSRVARDMKGALEAQDLQGFGELLTENWECQKVLHPSISTPRLDEIVTAALAGGALGGKACGAGGGGCLVFLAKSGEEERLRQILKRGKSSIIEFDFDTYGVHLTKG
jgi:D-glycero-alpha-D-manno-heptose-7-phosphate kinase